MWQINSASWGPKIANSNPGQLVHSVRKHLCLSHWVFSELRTLSWAPRGPWMHTGTQPTGTDQHIPAESHLASSLITTPPKARLCQVFAHPLPVMPNVWTLITHLNSKKINRVISVNLKSLVTHSYPFHGAPAGPSRSSRNSLQAPCSPSAAQGSITLSSADQRSRRFLSTATWIALQAAPVLCWPHCLCPWARLNKIALEK